MQPHGSVTIVYFGVFEVDLVNAELRKSGLRLRIQEQPFEVLAALVARPNQVVSREELVARLWPSGTFVDYERGLNAAVARLRQVLNDSAETPRYIETVARRGYRFVGHMEVGSNAMARGSGLPSLQTQAMDSAAPGFVRRLTGRSGWLLIGITAITATVVLAVRHSIRPSSPPRILGYSQLTHDGRAKAYLNYALPVVVTDGSRVYFIETATGPMRSALHQVSQSGGETSAVMTGLRENVDIGDISPEGSELLLQTFVSPEPEMRLWTLHLPGGGPRRLGDVRGRDATWSPDGQRIAYAKGNDLYVCSADGSENTRLVSGREPISWPRWSPDGTRLRYTQGTPAGLTIIEEVSVRGTEPRPVLPGWKGLHCCGNWTADGKYYVFQADGATSTDLWVIRERQGLFQRANQPIRLTMGPMDFRSAAPSRDGKRIFAIGSQPRGELVRYDPKTRQFGPYLGGISADGVETSRDGQWCAFVSYPDGVLWRSRADGTDRLQLTPPSMHANLPRWSPDGKRIAFMAQTGIEPWAIYLVSPEGGKLERVVTEQHHESDPSWSPDGAFLAFGRLPWLEAGSWGAVAIQIVNMKTRQVTILPGSDGLFSPHWSPDGRYLLGMTSTQPASTLKLFDFDKRTWQALADISAAYPNWSVDGKYVHFINPYRAVPELYRFRVSDSKIERIAALDPQQLGWTIVGKWMGLAGDDSPLVLRDTGIQEIFSLTWERP